MNKKQKLNYFNWSLLLVGFSIFLLVNTNQYKMWSTGLDYSIYDGQVQLFSQAANDEIVIIEIDEQSLSLLGDWPWPRSYHAQLISLLSEAQPGVIAYNVIFSSFNPEDQNDIALSDAIEKGGKTVLPLYFDKLFKQDGVTEVLPALSFRENAQLGHVNSYLDGDGTLRSVRFIDRFDDNKWPHFSLASFLFNEEKSIESISERTLDNAYIPFVTEGDFQRYSFVDVLAGLIPLDRFLNKTIFVGVTATSIGDPLLIPISDRSRQTPAVDINANIYQALENNQLIHLLPAEFAVLINTIFIFISLYLIRKLSAIQQFFVMIFFIGLIWALGFLLLHLGFWFKIAGLIIALVSMPFIWNLLRLSLLFKYFREQIVELKAQQANENFHLPNYFGLNSKDDLISCLKLMQIDDYRLLSSDIDEQKLLTLYESKETIIKKIHLSIEGEEKLLLLNFTNYSDVERNKLNLLKQLALRPEESLNAIDSRFNALDVFSQQLSLITESQKQLSMTHLLFEESIEGVTSGILVSDITGRILFSNRALGEITQVEIKDVKSLTKAVALIKCDWVTVLRDVILLKQTMTVEAKLGEKDLSVSIHCIQNNKSVGSVSLFPLVVLNITDISAIKQANRSRSEMIDFLSHDMRSPMASLQALVNQSKSLSINEIDVKDLINKVDLYSKRGLSFAEQFLELAKVESEADICVYELDLYSVVQNAFDTLYHQAQEKSISLSIVAEDNYWVISNGEMLERIVLNLASNAIKYSPSQSQVIIQLSKLEGGLLRVSVTDQGPGIPESLLTNLFKPYSRGTDLNSQKAQGVGLGLRFVDVALKKLHSQIQFESSHNGAKFYFDLNTIDI